MKKRRILLSVIISMIFFTFLGVLDYPYLAQLYHDKILEDEIEKEENQEWIAILEIPKIQLKLPVYDGVSEDVLQKGAGILPESSYPGGGTGTHTCISGHRGLPDRVLFTNLDQVENGDVFYIHMKEQTLTYEVYEIETVTPENVDSLGVQEGKDLATLITCTPYGINSHRLYIHGMRNTALEDEGITQEDFFSMEKLWKDYWWVVVTMVAMTWLVIFLYLFNRENEEFEEIKEGEKHGKGKKTH